jgi:hypothetical protein
MDDVAERAETDDQDVHRLGLTTTFLKAFIVSFLSSCPS